MKVSVCIPTLNEEHSIVNFLQALEQQTVKPYEVVVVDGGSTDRTVDRILEVADNLSFPVHIWVYEGSSIGEARQLAAEKAEGDIIATSDADVEAEPDWIERIIGIFSNPSVIAMWGRIKYCGNNIFRNKVVQMASEFFKGMGANSAYRKQVLACASYPAINQGEDVAFFTQIEQKCDGDIVYDSETVVCMHADDVRYELLPQMAISTIGAIAGLLIRRISKPIGNVVLSMSIGFGISSLAAYLLKDSQRDLHVHHDVIGAGLIALSTLKLIPESYAHTIRGFGIGSVIHHILTEPDGCDDGVCLIRKNRMEDLSEPTG